jgi:hypothetical protein
MADTVTSSPPANPVGWRLLIVFIILYIFTSKGYIEISDTYSSLQTAEAIVTRGRLDIPPDAATTTVADGRSYSKYGIGLPVAFVPVVALSHLLGVATGHPPLELAGFFISFLNIPFVLLTLVLFGRLLEEFGATPGYARLLTVGLALGTLCWRYAVYDFSEGMQTALLTLAVYGVVGKGSGRLVVGGLGFAGLVLVKLVHVVLLPIFIAYLLWRWRTAWGRWTRMVSFFVFPVLLALGLVGWLNAIRFGSPLETGYGTEARQFLPAQMPDTLPRLLGSLDKGLFVFCPVLALGVAGWSAFFRRYPREAALCGALALGNLLLAASWHSWVGGWSWGPRLLVPAIPLWLLPAGLAFGGSPSARAWASVAGLVLVSVVVQVPGVLVKDQQIHHIGQNMLTEPERAAFPANWPAAWIMLKHKLTRPDEVYSVDEFGLPSDRHLDLTRYRTFNGLNLWTEHISRQFNMPSIRWLPLFSLAAVLILGGWATRAARRKGLDV